MRPAILARLNPLGRSSGRRCGQLLLVLGCPLLAACAEHGQAEPVRELRVCADPNNLPFSNERGEGFENRLAELFARELNAKVTYTWHAQQRGVFRETLRAGVCDVVMGIPAASSWRCRRGPTTVEDDRYDEDAAPPVGRSRWLAVAGLIMNPFFALIILG